MQYIIIGIILLFIYIYFENYNLKVNNYIISSPKIPKEFDGTKFLVLADLHNNSFGKNNELLIEEIKKVNPEFILIAGDMLVGAKKYEDQVAFSFIEQLVKSYPVYYGYGNHEQRIMLKGPHYHEEFKSFYSRLVKLGVNFLLNDTTHIIKGTAKINITGIVIDKDYFKKGSGMKMTEEYLQDLVGNNEEECYNILIGHNPSYFESYAKWGADLTVAGHVHGGLIRLPKLGGMLSPQYIFFPKYDAGRFDLGNKTMLVSRGLGMHTIKIRINNPPELMVVHLQNSEN